MNIWTAILSTIARFGIASSLMAVCATPASACDCWPVSSTLEARKAATLVFEGEVLQMKRFSVDKLGKDYKEFAVKMRVVNVWKGPVEDYLIIRTAAEVKDCGFRFENGSSYIVYAIGGPIPHVTSCTRTAESKSATAENDKKFLGPGEQP